MSIENFLWPWSYVSAHIVRGLRCHCGTKRFGRKRPVPNFCLPIYVSFTYAKSDSEEFVGGSLVFNTLLPNFKIPSDTKSLCCFEFGLAHYKRVQAPPMICIQFLYQRIWTKMKQFVVHSFVNFKILQPKFYNYKNFRIPYDAKRLHCSDFGLVQYKRAQAILNVIWIQFLHAWKNLNQDEKCCPFLHKFKIFPTKYFAIAGIKVVN